MKLARKVQNAVFAEPDVVGPFARLKVNVGNARVHRLLQYFVYESDNGGGGLEP